jgi:hypothetical protein
MNLSPRRDKHGFDLISDALPFGRLWYVEVNDCEDQELDGDFNPAGVMK